MKRVCMIVPNRMVKGGIAAVVNGYRGSQLEKDYEITYVESYKDGSKFDKLLKGICGYFHFAFLISLWNYWINFYDMGLYTGVYKIDNSSCKESFRVGRTYILSKDVSSNLGHVLYILFWCSSN